MAGNRPARERFDFSLDARQVAAVILGSLGALAVAFYLGHVLGRRVAERAPQVAAAVPAAAAPVTAADLPAITPPPRPEGGPYKDTFHDALVSKNPPTEALPPAPKGAPPPAPKPEPRASAPTAAEVAPPPAASGAPSPAQAPAPTPATAAATAVPAAAAPVPAAPAAAPKTAPPPGKPQPAAQAKAAPAPPPAKAAPAVAKGPAGKGAFAIQVGATQDRAEADRIAARYASRGAKVSVADVPGKGRFYRVRLGSFDSREAADRYLRDLQRTNGAKGFVTAAN